MKTLNSTGTVCLLFLPFCSFAQNICGPILENGIRDNYSIYTSQETYSLYQNALCNTEFDSYASFAANIRNSGLSLRTAEGLLGMSSNTDAARAQFSQQYSRFCSATYDEAASDSQFSRSISKVNTELANVYTQCVRDISKFMGDRNLNVYIGVSTQSTFDRFSVQVTRRTSSETKLTSILPNSVACSYGGAPISLPFVTSLEKFSVECTKSPNEPVTFSIDTEGEGFSNEVLIPAQRDRLFEMEQKIESLQARYDRAVSEAAPSGLVASFSTISCPSGWSEYAPAYGRFIRGIDNSGGNIDPNGKRAPGSVQNDQFQAHRHSFTYTAFGHQYNNQGLPNKSEDDDGKKLTDTTSSQGGKETRPKNVALLFCRKK